MTTELVLLLSMFVFIVLGGFIKDGGPRKTFEESAPRLAARLERDIATGADFAGRDGNKAKWLAPKEKIDTGELK